MYYKKIKGVFFSYYQCIYSILILRKSLQYACILHSFSVPDHFTVLISKENSPLNSHICNNLYNLITMSLIRKKREKISWFFFFCNTFQILLQEVQPLRLFTCPTEDFPQHIYKSLCEACGYTNVTAGHHPAPCACS